MIKGRMGKIKIAISVMEALAVGLFIAVIVLYAQADMLLPDRIPQAAEQGEVVAWSDKTMFTVVFLLAFLVYGVLFVLKRFPRFMAFPVKLSAQNIHKQASIARLMLAVVTLLAMAAFALLLYSMYEVAVNPMTAVMRPAILVLLGSIVLAVAGYIVVARLHRMR